MILLYSILYFHVSSALLVTTEDRNASRNLTCRYGTDSNLIPGYTTNCEACLITSRNYQIETTLSLTGVGPSGVSYRCLQYNDIEGYHENLVRECHYFSRDVLSGYDDFCIASPYSLVRGSYRACICASNLCNIDYTRCIRQANLHRDSKTSVFSNTVVELTNKIKCYQPEDDYNQQTYSNLTQLCTKGDRECQNYVFDHGVLCAISVDRTNKIARQTLIPSIYAAYLIKYKTEICNVTETTSKSIYFSQCELEDTVCMCTVNECDKDLETCRKSGTGQSKNIYAVYFLFILMILF
jgi:hypothetical protein